MDHFIVKYRRVFSDVSVHQWETWDELGEFDSLEKAIAAVEDIMKHHGLLEDVSMERDGLYQGRGDYQYRFPLVKGPESPWKVGLNET